MSNLNTRWGIDRLQDASSKLMTAAVELAEGGSLSDSDRDTIVTMKNEIDLMINRLLRDTSKVKRSIW